jgi:hypothetical protein
MEINGALYSRYNLIALEVILKRKNKGDEEDDDDEERKQKPGQSIMCLPCLDKWGEGK